MNKLHVRNIALLILLTAVMIFLYGQIGYTRPPYSRWDLANYRMMAEAAPQLAEKIPQPFAYRLLGPYLAGLLPLPEPLAFQLLTILSALALVTLFYWFLIDRKIPPLAALIAASVFVMNRALFGVSTWDFFQLNDVLVLIFMLILFLAMYRGRWLLFGIIFFLGVATRETTLILAPVVLVYLWKRGVCALKACGRSWRWSPACCSSCCCGCLFRSGGRG